MAIGKHISDKNPGGTALGQSSTDLISFFGATPVVQPSGTGQAAITDSGTGTAANTAAAGVGVVTVSIPLALVGITGNIDVVTTYTPGYKFKILAVDFAVTKIASTAAKLATLNLEIGTTNLTGGVVALTTANCGTLGAVVAGSAVTAANTGTSADTISVEASGVTAFVEGDGALLIKIQNMDTADAFASILQRTNKFRTDLVALGLIAGA